MLCMTCYDTFSAEKWKCFSINCLCSGWHFRSGSTEVAEQVALAVKQVISVFYKAAIGNGNVSVSKIVFEQNCFVSRAVLWGVLAAWYEDLGQLLLFILCRISKSDCIYFNMMFLIIISQKKHQTLPQWGGP